MKIDFSSIIGLVFQGAIDAAKKASSEWAKEATQDAMAFVNSSLPKIGRYVDFLADGEIDSEEFKSLMMGLKDLAELAALTQIEKSEIKIQETRNAILNAVTNVVVGAVSKAI